MKKLIAICAVMTLFLLLSAGVVLAKKGDKNAGGGFSKPKNVMMDVVIEGATWDGPLWLGFTWLTPTGDIDVDVQKVNGDFKKNFTVPLYKIDKNSMSCKYAVSLWRWKVSKKECNRGPNGGPCNFCKKNGYHMEDRVSSIKGGKWSTN